MKVINIFRRHIYKHKKFPNCEIIRDEQGLPLPQLIEIAQEHPSQLEGKHRKHGTQNIQTAFGFHPE
jgi:hypothetical protein